MSRIHGADEFLNDLKKLGAEMPQIEKQMLSAAGEEMAKAWRMEIRMRGFISKGRGNNTHMVDSIVWQFHRSKRAGARLAVEVTAKGTDDHGTRQGMKAFVLHYGTSGAKGVKIPASHWVDEAEESGMYMAEPAMRAILDQALNSTIGANR